MDAVTDPDIKQIVVIKSAQIGWTEILNNIVGYFIDQDPCPMMVIQPTEAMAETWSKDRLMPMVRDTVCLTEKFKATSRDAGNTILHKSFPGGHLTAIGANAPSGLASRPIRVVLGDEVDRYPASAGAEGDPVNLAAKRTKTFFNRKMMLGSTPTLKNFSRIEKAFNNSDQRRFFVPCPDCGEFQHLKWSQIKWPKGQRELAYYVCEHCGVCIDENSKDLMVRNGEWRATAPFNGIAGFHIWEGYSPWSTWAEIAIEHGRVKDDPQQLKTWVNTTLGETWEDEAERVDEASIYARREEYLAQVPREVLVICAGVDVQRDRLEVEIKGFGLHEETWSIDYRVIYGDPSQPEVWQTLDLLWEERFLHETGAQMYIDSACIDSSDGNTTKYVYDYCRTRRARRIFCIKGRGGAGIPAISAPSEKRTGVNRRPVALYTLGVDAIKALIYQRLRIIDPGPGYMHFPESYQESYFNQLTAEAITEKFERGFKRQVWVKIKPRNEVLDCTVYSFAAFMILNPPMGTLSQKFKETGRVRLPISQQTSQRTYRKRGIAV